MLLPLHTRYTYQVASGRKPKQRVELDASSLAKLDEYATNWEKAFEELIRIRPRDRGFSTKSVIPFRLRTAQKKAWKSIQWQRSFNIYKSLKRQYPDEYETVLASVLQQLTCPKTAYATTQLILKARPEWVLKQLHVLGYDQVTDSPVLIIIVKARQMGFSTLIEVVLFLYALFNPRSTVLIVSSDDKSVEHVLNMATTIVEEWPEELRALAPELTGDARDRLELYNKSKYETRSSEGRRIHSLIVDASHFTEYAHYKSDDRVAAAVVAAPAHAWLFIESTSAGPAGDYYEKVQQALTIEQIVRNYDAKITTTERQYAKVFCSWLEDPEYTAHVEDWELTELKASLDDYEKNLFKRFPPGATLPDGTPAPVCTYGRIKWRREKIKNDCQKGKDRNGRSLTPEQYFMQEFPSTEEEAFQEGSGSVFPSEVILKAEGRALEIGKKPTYFRLRDAESNPELVLHKHLSNLMIYELPQADREYSIGADVGKGRGRDNTALTILDRLDGTAAREVAHFASNLLTEIQTAHICVMLARLYNNAFITPEVTGVGQAFVNEITQVIQYSNVFLNRQFTTAGGKGITNTNYGYDTSSAARKDLLISELKQALMDGTLEVHTMDTFHELRMFQFVNPEDPKSQMEARQGEKDDRVISLSLANLGRLARFGAPPIRNYKPTGSESTPAPTKPSYDDVVSAHIEELCKQADRPRRKRRRSLDNQANFLDLTAKWN